jgi:NAD+ diphosphatase
LRPARRYAILDSMKSPNFFGETGLDRKSDRRTDQDWLRALTESADAVVLPIWRTRNLIVQQGGTPAAVCVSYTEVSAILSDEVHPIFLGLRAGVPHFAVDLSHMDDPLSLPELSGKGEFADIRDAGLDLPLEDGGLLAYVKAIANWHDTHKFCGRCGSPCESRDGGHMRECTNPDCKTQHFPRTDPAVIMLVHSGDRIVLARKKGWPEDRYSILAGFVEQGETLEGAVVREVMEEVGIPVTNVHYHSCQPWPFPANLMFGFFAEAQSEKIRIDDIELAHARWFHRDELIEEARAYAEKPHSVSIARRLMSEWALGREP